MPDTATPAATTITADELTMTTMQLTWHNNKTHARITSAEANDHLPAYIAISLGSIQHSTDIVMTPADAIKLAEKLYIAAIRIEPEPDLLNFHLPQDPAPSLTTN